MHRLVLAALIVLCSTASAPGKPTLHELSQEPSARLSIRLFVRSAISEVELTRARRSAWKIFADAGVDAQFLLCDMRERPIPARCDQAFAPGEISVQIMARDIREDGALGYALPGAESSPGRYVRIFDDGVRALAKQHRLQHGDVLGHVLSHEIGHLLLGVGRHTKRGLMRADWSLTDLARMGREGLWFSTGQARRIRAALVGVSAAD